MHLIDIMTVPFFPLAHDGPIALKLCAQWKERRKSFCPTF